jgi:hypothetical protein
LHTTTARRLLSILLPGRSRNWNYGTQKLVVLTGRQVIDDDEGGPLCEECCAALERSEESNKRMN